MRKVCEHGIHHQPNGPFAIVVFCEDALGNSIGLIYYDPLYLPYNGKWELSDRMWQDWLWASDVTGFLWSADGKRLYVSTSDIYGSGGFFEIELLTKSVRQIAPLDYKVTTRNPGQGYVINSVDPGKGVLYYSIAPWNSSPDNKAIQSLPIGRFISR